MYIYTHYLSLSNTFFTALCQKMIKKKIISNPSSFKRSQVECCCKGIILRAEAGKSSSTKALHNRCHSTLQTFYCFAIQIKSCHDTLKTNFKWFHIRVFKLNLRFVKRNPFSTQQWNVIWLIVISVSHLPRKGHDGTQAVWKIDMLHKITQQAITFESSYLPVTRAGGGWCSYRSSCPLGRSLWETDWCNVIVSMDPPFLDCTLFLLHSPDVNK